MDYVANVKAARRPPADWEAQKDTIKRLYVVENRPLKDVIQILANKFGFTASEKQLKSRFSKWGFDVKNVKAETMVELARTKVKRKLDNKESMFRVNKQAVNEQRIDHFLKRNKITEDELLAMASPENALPPTFSVATPPSCPSNLPGDNTRAASARSQTPGLDFQSLSISQVGLRSAVINTEGQLESPRLSGASDAAHSPRSYTQIQGPAPLTGIQESELPQSSSPDRVTDWSFDSPVVNASSSSGTDSQTLPKKLPLVLLQAQKRSVLQGGRILHKDMACRYHFESIWSCDFCKEDGGMTTRIDHCPNCGHLRCSMCIIEIIKILEHW